MNFTCLDVVYSVNLGAPKKSGREHLFSCPNHEDEHPSLSINPNKDCWMCGPCGADGNAWALAAFVAGYSPDDKGNLIPWLCNRNLITGNKEGREFVCAYVYEDENRNPLFRVERYRAPPPKKKTFLQSRPDGNSGWISGTKGVRKVPFLLPDFIDQLTVNVMEGEADCEALREWRLPATTNAMGAGSWKPEYNQYFKNKQVCIFPDNDADGKAHAKQVAKNLFPVAKAVKIVRLPGLSEKGDFRDWKAAGGTLREFKEIVKSTPVLTEDDINRFSNDSHNKSSRNPWDKAISAPEFLASTDLEVDWLEQNLLAQGAITEIFSPRGIGKSLVAHAFGIRLARRGKRVLLADRDNPPREVKRRLKMWGAKDAPNFKVLTRDEVPPLTNKAAWLTFPFRDYDLVIIDALDSTAEGVGEQDSSKPSKAIASILDIAHRADGPAVLVLGNTIKSAQHSRGSGVIEDRADIVFEVRDATDLTPSGTKDWWLELPAAGAEEWANRASRRQKRDRFKLAFIPSKFRVGEEPEPFILEVDLSDEPWVLQDVTDEILQQGEEALNKAKQEREERLAAAVEELIGEVEASAQLEEAFKSEKDAVPFLMERGLRRKEARNLIKDRDGVAWRIETLNKQGKPTILLPLVHTPSDVSKETAEINKGSENPIPIGVSEPHVSAAPMNTGRRKHGVAEPLPHRGSSESGLFPPGVSEEPPDPGQCEGKEQEYQEKGCPALVLDDPLTDEVAVLPPPNSPPEGTNPFKGEHTRLYPFIGKRVVTPKGGRRTLESPLLIQSGWYWTAARIKSPTLTDHSKYTP